MGSDAVCIGIGSALTNRWGLDKVGEENIYGSKAYLKVSGSPSRTLIRACETDWLLSNQKIAWYDTDALLGIVI